MTYPEHDKLRAIRDKSQAIGEFVEWLEQEKSIHLASYGTERFTENELFVSLIPIQTLLAEFFDIDQKKLAAEKDAMLERQRELNKRPLRPLRSRQCPKHKDCCLFPGHKGECLSHAEEGDI